MLPPWCPCRHRPVVAAPVQAGAASAEEHGGSGEKDAIAKPSRAHVFISKAMRDHLEGKGYAAALKDIAQTTSLRFSDIDPKALRLLDILDQKGTSLAACQQLRQTLEGIPRQRIGNWRTYVYSLFRSFDADAYRSLKDNGKVNGVCPGKELAHSEATIRRPREPKADVKTEKEDKKFPLREFDFRFDATEFIPGHFHHGPEAEASSREAAECAALLLEELAPASREPRRHFAGPG